MSLVKSAPFTSQSSLYGPSLRSAARHPNLVTTSPTMGWPGAHGALRQGLVFFFSSRTMPSIPSRICIGHQDFNLSLTSGLRLDKCFPLTPNFNTWYDATFEIPATVRMHIVARTTNFLRVWVAYARGMKFVIPHKLRRQTSVILICWIMCYTALEPAESSYHWRSHPAMSCIT